jgi:catechol-2,3-dioxygenase
MFASARRLTVVMSIHRLNHAVLYVRDVEITTEFYGSVLGFRVVNELPGAAFLCAPDSTNDHDLGVFQIGAGAAPSDAGRSTVGLYHLAWEVDTLGELQRLAGVLRERGALVGATDHGTTKSLYARDPDGIEFEVVWIIPAHLLTDDDLAARMAIRPLDLPAEIERFGADERGGIGISVPA